MYKVLICGHFGYGKDFFDGQTVKTKILTEELKCQLGKEFVTTIDTMNLTKKPLEFLYLSFKMFKNSENIIISELIKILEIHLGMRAKIDFIKTPDENFSIDISQIEQIAKESGILFGSNYVLEVLKKYY